MVSLAVSSGGQSGVRTIEVVLPDVLHHRRGNGVCAVLPLRPAVLRSSVADTCHAPSPADAPAFRCPSVRAGPDRWSAARKPGRLTTIHSASSSRSLGSMPSGADQGSYRRLQSRIAAHRVEGSEVLRECRRCSSAAHPREARPVSETGKSRIGRTQKLNHRSRSLYDGASALSGFRG